MTVDEDAVLIEQIAKQCDAVAHLAKTLAIVHSDLADILRGGSGRLLAETWGQRSAAIMETLGDILNDMDAVDEGEDDWMAPVFAEAHRLWSTDPSLVERERAGR